MKRAIAAALVVALVCARQEAQAAEPLPGGGFLASVHRGPVASPFVHTIEGMKGIFAFGDPGTPKLGVSLALDRFTGPGFYFAGRIPYWIQPPENEPRAPFPFSFMTARVGGTVLAGAPWSARSPIGMSLEVGVGTSWRGGTAQPSREVRAGAVEPARPTVYVAAYGQVNVYVAWPLPLPVRPFVGFHGGATSHFGSPAAWFSFDVGGACLTW
jgi:hypothetical protein